MAETNHTSSATNSDCNASSPGVPSNAASAREGFTRRTMMRTISAATAVPAFAYSGLAGAAQMGPGVDRRAWNAGMAKWCDAKRRYDSITGTASRVYRRYEKACAAIPHQAFTSDVFHRTLTTASSDDLATARRFLGGLKKVDPESGLTPYEDICQKVIAADEGRTTEMERVAERIGYRAAVERENSASDALSEAGHELLTLPAPDGEALLWKLDHLYGADARDADGGGAGWCSEFVDAYMADARRLLSVGRA